MRDHVIRIHDFDVVLLLDIAGRDHAFAGFLQRERRFVAPVHFQHDALQVEQDVDHVFLDAIDRRILVQNACDLDFGCGVARHG